jgi:hypothetical protein
MGEMNKLNENLGQYLFGVCGVPGVAKRHVFISHEHRDEVPDPGELLRKCPDAIVHISGETLAVLMGKAGLQAVPIALKVNFKDRFKVHLTDYMWYGKVWDVGEVLMFRIEHDSPDPSFRSHVAFGFAKRGLFCYFSEATGKFLMEYGEQIIRQVEPKYVVVSPPSYMHKLTAEHLARFKKTVEESSTEPLLIANFVVSEQLLLSEEVGVQPSGFIILPKQVKSVFDVYGPI